MLKPSNERKTDERHVPLAASPPVPSPNNKLLPSEKTGTRDQIKALADKPPVAHILTMLAVACILVLSSPTQAYYEFKPLMQPGNTRLADEIAAAVKQKDWKLTARLLQTVDQPQALINREGVHVSMFAVALEALEAGGDALQAQIKAQSNAYEGKPGADMGALVGDIRRSAGNSERALKLLQQASQRAQRRQDVWAISDLSQLGDELGLDVQRTPDPTPPTSVIPLAMDARWFGHFKYWTAPRVIPGYADDTFYLAVDSKLAAVHVTGRVKWQTEFRRKTGSRIMMRTGDWSVGYNMQPAVFTDHEGKAQIIVTRQRSSKKGELALRAILARNGETLWTTDEPNVPDHVFTSPPVVRGRYVYVIGMSYDNSPFLEAMAYDLLNGKLIWKTQLGRYDRVHRNFDDDDFRKRRSRAATLYWEVSQPAIAGRRLILTPNSGHVICLDRFTGDVEWKRAYPQKPQLVDNTAVRMALNQRNGPFVDQIPLSARLRWHSTPIIAGDYAVCAPMDSTSVFALHLRDGKLKWNSEIIPSMTPVGAVGDRVLFCAREAAALDIETGKHLWRWQPQQGQYITGPAAVADGELAVHTDKAMWLIDAKSGKARPAPPVQKVWRRFVGSRAGRTLLIKFDIDDLALMPPPPDGR